MKETMDEGRPPSARTMDDIKIEGRPLRLEDGRIKDRWTKDDRRASGVTRTRDDKEQDGRGKTAALGRWKKQQNIRWRSTLWLSDL
jgi:hypothetical protein